MGDLISAHQCPLHNPVNVKIKVRRHTTLWFKNLDEAIVKTRNDILSKKWEYFLKHIPKYVNYTWYSNSRGERRIAHYYDSTMSSSTRLEDHINIVDLSRQCFVYTTMPQEQELDTILEMARKINKV